VFVFRFASLDLPRGLYVTGLDDGRAMTCIFVVVSLGRLGWVRGWRVDGSILLG
jgi:hypothetical protein